MRSIRENLLSLEDAVEIFPGHGPATTIGMERRSNPFLVSGFAEGLLGGAD
jgi:glyoxylase-like metal-dependent hydrolase (beta-lactamase superfamily II)